jgi:hypothetical protein
MEKSAWADPEKAARRIMEHAQNWRFARGWLQPLHESGTFTRMPQAGKDPVRMSAARSFQSLRLVEHLVGRKDKSQCSRGRGAGTLTR